MKSVLRAISLTIQLFFILLIGLVGGVYLGGRFGYLAPVKPYVVLSGSMEPTIKTGGIVVATPRASGYGVGDIITFTQGKDQTTTHRVTEIIKDSGGIKYLTKGDANKTADNTPISKDNVVGAVILTLPYLGYAVDFAKKPQGFILLVIIPATIIVYEELRFLKHELARLLKKRAPKAKMVATPPPAFAYYPNAPLPPLYHPPKTVSAPPPQRSGVDKRWLVVPTIAAVTIFLGVSGAYFFDTETSLGNVLGAASSFTSPLRSTAPGELNPELVEGTPTATPSATPEPTPTETPTASPSSVLSD